MDVYDLQAERRTLVVRQGIVETPVKGIEVLSTLPRLESLMLFRERIAWQPGEREAYLEVIPKLEHVDALRIGGCENTRGSRTLRDQIPRIEVIDQSPF